MKKAYNVIFLVIILEITGTYTSDDEIGKYCGMESCKHPDPTISEFPLHHTGCASDIDEPSRACNEYYRVLKVGLNVQEQRDVINKHNEIRANVASGQEERGNPGPQPPAISIPPLTWDDELARLAQGWANQCKEGTDKCRDVERFKVNQLAVKHKFSNLTVRGNLSEVVEYFHDDVDYFDYRTLPTYVFNLDAIGYTQLVWANTTHFGCGYVEIARKDRDRYYTSTFFGDELYAKILVCNYGPAGNVVGDNVYDINTYKEYAYTLV